MIGIFRIRRSKPKRNASDRLNMNVRPKMVPTMTMRPSHHQATTKSDIAMTMSVGNGKSAPKLVNTCLNAGMTQTMMTQTTTIATQMTEIG